MTDTIPEIEVPHNFKRRNYQKNLHRAFESGYKRAIIVWHRRCGKDLACFSDIVVPEMCSRVGYYMYCYPTSVLGRRAMWDGMDSDGIKFLDRIPKELIDGKPNKVEMKLTLSNGSIFQVVGIDKITNVGINPIGVVFSEHSLQNPAGWDYIRPILRENKGWALFNFTPRGRNHAYDLYEMAKKNDKWFTELLTVEDTGVLTPEDIEEERRSGMSEELIQQEYYCSFSRGIEGSFYGRLMDQARLGGRITNVPYDSQMKVSVSFDLGWDDSMALWFWQQVGQEIRLIDYYEARGEAIPHYAKVLKDKHYIYGDIWLPPDARVHELGTGLSRIDVFRNLGISALLVPEIGLMDGIEVVRGVLSRCWFDEKRCDHGIKALEMYHKSYNDKLDVYSNRPVHDCWSHGADSFRYASIAIKRGSLAGGELSSDEWNRARKKHLL